MDEIRDSTGQSKDDVSHWFLDFDDTLAIGSTTWGHQYGFPRLIEKHGLTYDPKQFQEALLIAQKKANYSLAYESILYDLFLQMEWPPNLQESLLSDLTTNYRPELFDETVEFLERLESTGKPIIVISNNSHTPQIAERLGIARFFTRVFTPKLCGGCKPKPHTELWNYVVQNVSGVNINNSVMIGDDPWSDGAFAVEIGLPCWIIDRSQRMTSLRGQYPVGWVQSLLEIPISNA